MQIVLYSILVLFAGNLHAYFLNPRYLGKNVVQANLNNPMSHKGGLTAARPRNLDLKASSETPTRTPSPYINIFMAIFALPALAELIPVLLVKVTDFSVGPMERQKYIIGLLLFKRVFLYATAIIGLDWCAKRCASDRRIGLGERLGGLNEEIFDGLPDGWISPLDEHGKKMTLGTNFNNQAAPLLDRMNDIDGKDQALAVPALVAASLLASFAGLRTSQELLSWFTSNAIADNSSPVLGSALQNVVFGVGPVISAVATTGVCALFSKAELQRLFAGIEKDSNGRIVFEKKQDIAILIAIVFSAIAVFNPIISKLVPPSALNGGRGLWPVGNVVNLLVGVTISRAFLLPTLPLTILALTGLVVYDAFFVLGTQALTDGGQGIMEAVAMAKLQSASSAVQGAASSVVATTSSATSNSDVMVATVAHSSASIPMLAASEALWQPGLLTVYLNGKVSDALGLGDVIFPSLLAGWALRFDNRPNRVVSTKASSSYYRASLAGYALGCVLCELLQTGAGAPALLYVVPSMILTMFISNIPALLDEESRKELLDFDG